MDNIDIHSYDKYIVSYSGWKDSTAAFLYLLDQGVPIQKIELWHQDIDGRKAPFFDWPITVDYCKRFADHFGVAIYYQWKEGGFRREMLRYNELTAPTWFECPDGSVRQVGGVRGKAGTRLKFPQCSADLSVRWCSSYLKIDVCSTSIINQERFRGIRTLVISGERGEESPQRAKYNQFEPDKADLRNGINYTRHIDRLRPLLYWKESQVWEIIERYRVRVHPCYYMGWSRCSCLFCIFGNADQFASAAVINPKIMNEISEYEKQFQCTIKRNVDIQSLVDSGTPYPSLTPEPVNIAKQFNYNLPIVFPESEQWVLPAGAYSDTCGSN